MGKINKYANIYNKDGEIIRKVDEAAGKLKPYTIEELEELVDKLATDKDENGQIKDPQSLNNANSVLFMMYQQNPDRLKQLLKDMKQRGVEKTTEEQVQEAMQQLENELNAEEEQPKQELEMERYVDFEEVKEEAA